MKIQYERDEMTMNLVSLCSKFKVWPFNNGINRACFLTKPTVDALGHVNVIPGSIGKSDWTTKKKGVGEGEAGKEGLSPSCPSTSIFSLLGLNCDRLGWTYLIKL